MRAVTAQGISQQVLHNCTVHHCIHIFTKQMQGIIIFLICMSISCIYHSSKLFYKSLPFQWNEPAKHTNNLQHMHSPKHNTVMNIYMLISSSSKEEWLNLKFKDFWISLSFPCTNNSLHWRRCWEIIFLVFSTRQPVCNLSPSALNSHHKEEKAQFRD